MRATYLRLGAGVALTCAAIGTAAAQGLDPSPASACGQPNVTATTDSVRADSRVLVRFAPGLATNREDAYLSRALGTLVAERVTSAVDVDVRSRGFGGGPAETGAASAVAEGRVLGVRFVLVGVVRNNDGRSIVSWRLVDARSGKEVGAGTVSQPTMAADSLVSVMTNTLTRAFGRPPSVPSLHDRIATGSTAALRNYFEALTELESFTREHLQNADSLLKRAVDTDPKFLAAHFRQAEVSLRLLDWVEQEDSYRTLLVNRGLRAIGTVLMQEPRNPEALALLGRLYLHSGTPKLATPVVAALQKLAPTSAAYVTLRAQSLRALGDDREALTFLRSVSGGSSRNTTALMVHADLERRLGEERTSCRLLNRAVALDPVFTPAYVWRSVVRSHLGERREGWADAEVASRLGRLDWGELAAGLIDVSVSDTVRAKTRLAASMGRTALEQAGWLDLVLRAAVAYGLKAPTQAQQALAQISCTDPRRAQLRNEPLLQHLRIPTDCRGRVATAKR